jgi:c-di-GMP-binding flagellar brake protein YcgR
MTPISRIEKPLDVEQDPDLEHFLVRSRSDILPVLQAMARRGTPVIARIEGASAPLATRLLSVKPHYEELVFDAAGMPDFDRLDGGQSLEVRATLDSVQIVFTARHLEPAPAGGLAAFRGRMPQTIARIQRRNSARYPVPSLNPPVCQARIPPASDRLRSLRVMDISLAGMAVVLDDPQVELPVGMALPDCRVELPQVGAVETGLVVSYVSRQGADARRIGFRFDGLSIPALAHIRRYVGKLEHGR